jgi:hypothetical protein
MSVEAVLAEMNGTWTTKKRTKKRASLVNSGSYSINAVPYHGKIVVYNQHKFSAKALGTFCKNSNLDQARIRIFEI